MLILEHLKLIDGDVAEMKKLRKALLEAAPDEDGHLVTIHEADLSCCRREPWQRTWSRIVAAVRPPVTPCVTDIDHSGGEIPLAHED